MCDPTLAMVGINAVGTMSGISAQNDAADAQTRYQYANARNAKLAANNQYEQQQRSYIEESRSIIQAGMDTVLQGRAAEAAAYTSAIQNGARGASVKALMRDKGMKASRNAQRTAQELRSLETATEGSLKNINDTTKGRIASVRGGEYTSFGLGDAVGILAPIAKYGSDTIGINGIGD